MHGCTTKLAAAACTAAAASGGEDGGGTDRGSWRGRLAPRRSVRPVTGGADSLRGGDPEVRRVVADGAGQVDVAAGDPADIVA